jgi:hypothetical protein
VTARLSSNWPIRKIQDLENRKLASFKSTPTTLLPLPCHLSGCLIMLFTISLITYLSSPVLASFVQCLLATIGNSILSEQAFSTMNYIYSKIRNRLSTDHANKLQYIYINSQVLSKQSYYKPTENNLLQLKAEYRRFQILD